MLQWLAQFLTAPIVNGFLDAYNAKLDAANTTGAQTVEVTKAALLAEVEARKSAQAIIIAEQGRWYTALPRVVVEWSFALFVAKVVVWDTCLGWGSTPPLHGDVAAWAGLLMGLWFGGTSALSIARTIWRRP
jgi:hypothetical protein